MKNHQFYPIRKLLLATTSLLLANQVWACEKPQVSGYDTVDCLYAGLAAVKKDRKWGFINKTGKVVIPLQYDKVNIFGFSDGLVEVEKDGKTFKINQKGERVEQVD